MTGLNNSQNRIKILVVNTHPIQYLAPIWRKLAKQRGLEVEVLYGCDVSVQGYRDGEFGVDIRWDTNLLDGYSSRILESGKNKGIGFFYPAFWGVFLALWKSDTKLVLLTAYHSLFGYASLLACFFSGKKVIMRHEASDVALGRGRIRGVVRKLLLKLIYKKVEFFCVIGDNAKRHLLSHGVSDEKMVFSPYCVASDQVAAECFKWEKEREHIRFELGAKDDDILLLFSGKLIDKKNPLLIFDALEAVGAKILERLHVVIAGDGCLREEVKKRGKKLLKERFHFFGFLNQKQIGKTYAVSDFLILPSRLGSGETWGLVVNEAMQYGLPVVVSNGVGCYQDLVDDSTGRVFTSDSVDRLATAICSLVEELPRKRGEYERSCKERIAKYSIDAACGGIVDAIRKTTAAVGGIN